MISSLIRHWPLIRQLVRRDVTGRYKGSYLGVLWSFIQPALMVAVFTFVFSGVFRARWGIENESTTDFALIVFVGIIVHGFFAECAVRAPGLILSNANFVKRVVFPLETLSWVTVGAALIHAAIALFVLLAALIATGLGLHWTVFALPIVWLPLVLFCLATVLMLSSLGVFLRDLSQGVGIVVTAMMFLGPVFYPLKAVPSAWGWLVQANPLSVIIEQSRDVLIWGRMPDWVSLGLHGLGSGVFLLLAFLFFQRSRRGFADVV